MDSTILSSWAILTLHALATYSMFGLIWMVQWVHYPSFLRVDPKQFREFAKFHVDRISVLVVPLMFLELFTGVGLCLVPADGIDRGWFFLGLGLIVVIWVVTALLSVPAHRRLLLGFDRETIVILVRWNWVRTILWTVRAMGLTWVLWGNAGG